MYHTGNQNENSSDQLMNEVLKILAVDNQPSLGEVVERRREALKLSAKAASEVLGIPRTSYERLVKGELQKLDVLTALKLGHFLDISIEEILKLFAASSMPAEDFKEVERVKEASFIVKNFDIDTLKKIGFIKSSDYTHIKERIIEFFSLGSLYEYTREASCVLYSKGKVISDDSVMGFWILSAYKQFEKINNPYPFDLDQVKRLATQIRPYTRKEKTGLRTVIQALYKAGVTVITQKALPKTSVRGGTFIVNKKPCIVLTDLYKRYPTLWFTLLHELAHVIFHLNKLSGYKYHLTDGIEDAMLIENQADKFAQELLIPQEKYDYIKNHLNLETFVESYAAKSNIHPSIIYALHAWELREKGDDSGYARYNRFMPHSDICFDSLACSPWLEKNISESAEKSIKTLTTISN